MPVTRMLHPRIGDSDKIAKLTDSEFRAWIFYLLTADDFGVMPFAPAKLRGADRTIAEWSGTRIKKALDKFVSIGLVRTFEHNGSTFLWSPNWQKHQTMKYPRREETHYPAPPEQELELLNDPDTAPTRQLFATFHIRVSSAFRDRYGDPEALEKIRQRDIRRSRNVGVTFSEQSENDIGTSDDVPVRMRAPACETLTLTPNAKRLTPAFGVRSGEGDPPFDVWIRQLQAEYPPKAVSAGHLTEVAFLQQFSGDKRAPEIVWREMMSNLDNQKRGNQWRVKGMVPKLEKWLREGLWKQRHNAYDASDLSDATRKTLAGGEAFVAAIDGAKDR